MKRVGKPARTGDIAGEVGVLLPRLAANLRLPALLPREERELSMPQLVTLLVVQEGGEAGLPVGQAADRLGIRAGAVTALADRLEARGLIERVRGLDDRRVVLLRLTARGRSSLARLEETLAHAAGAALEGLSQAERERVARALREVVAFSSRIRDLAG